MYIKHQLGDSVKVCSVGLCKKKDLHVKKSFEMFYGDKLSRKLIVGIEGVWTLLNWL